MTGNRILFLRFWYGGPFVRLRKLNATWLPCDHVTHVTLFVKRSYKIVRQNSGSINCTLTSIQCEPLVGAFNLNTDRIRETERQVRRLVMITRNKTYFHSKYIKI